MGGMPVFSGPIVAVLKPYSFKMLSEVPQKNNSRVALFFPLCKDLQTGFFLLSEFEKQAEYREVKLVWHK